MIFSLIIPTHNRKDFLKHTLNSVANQDFSKEDFEVIVVDDGSKDSLDDSIFGFRSRLPNLVFHREDLACGPASARNIGILLAKSEIIGFTDDDCVLGRDWVRLMVETHQKNSDIAAVGGFTKTHNQKVSVLVSQFLSTCSIETHLGGKKEAVFFPTCNVSFKKGILEKQGFNEDFPLPGGEDLEFFWRLFKDGQRYIWNKEITVVHHRNGSMASFVKQAYIYGRGNLLVQHIHKDQPLLKELRTGKFSFWLATCINMLKTPRFSYVLGKRLIQENNIRGLFKKIGIFSFFALHKIFYLAGNIAEIFRINNHLDRKLSPLRLPNLMILDITHSCNLNCRICDIWKTASREKDTDILRIKSILSQAKELGIKEIALSGGEPLLREDIFGILDYASSLEIKNLGVLSNGISIKERIDRLKPYLLDNTVSLVVSLDSLSPDIHNEIRNSPVAWQETISSLNALSGLKKEFPQVNFNVITIILDNNLGELVGLAKFINSLGANSLQFQPLLSNNLRMAQRRKSDFWVKKKSLPELDAAINTLISLKRENPEFIKNSAKNLSLVKQYYRGTLKGKDVKCNSAYDTILVSNKGTYTTCFSSYGDTKCSNLKEVLTGRQISKAREQVRECSWPCLLPCFCDANHGQ